MLPWRYCSSTKWSTLDSVLWSWGRLGLARPLAIESSSSPWIKFSMLTPKQAKSIAASNRRLSTRNRWRWASSMGKLTFFRSSGVTDCFPPWWESATTMKIKATIGLLLMGQSTPCGLRTWTLSWMTIWLFAWLMERGSNSGPSWGCCSKFRT